MNPHMGQQPYREPAGETGDAAGTDEPWWQSPRPWWAVGVPVPWDKGDAETPDTRTGECPSAAHRSLLVQQRGQIERMAADLLAKDDMIERLRTDLRRRLGLPSADEREKAACRQRHPAGKGLPEPDVTEIPWDVAVPARTFTFTSDDMAPGDPESVALRAATNAAFEVRGE